jgi:hypothetical protein
VDILTSLHTLLILLDFDFDFRFKLLDSDSSTFLAKLKKALLAKGFSITLKSGIFNLEFSPEASFRRLVAYPKSFSTAFKQLDILFLARLSSPLFSTISILLMISSDYSDYGLGGDKI